MEIKTVQIENPDGLNLILGQSHFIKTVEDIHEAMVNAVPMPKFGVAFCEASDVCLVRSSGTDDHLTALAQKNALAIAAGHSFILFMKDLFPLNVLNTIKNVPEVCHIFLRDSQSGSGHYCGNVPGTRHYGSNRRVCIQGR